jgi:hypothetical protein
MISRACDSRFFPSDRYMTENVKSGSGETKKLLAHSRRDPSVRRSLTKEIPDQVRDDG